VDGGGGERAAAAAVTAQDEGPHDAGDGPWWSEQWWFSWWAPGGDEGGFVELVFLPNARRAWYRCVYVAPDLPLLAVEDLEVPLPRQGLRVRGHGLWADHVVEAPLRQWTVANETRALAVDDAEVLVGRAYGEQVPFALDLEWYADGAVTRLGAHAYEQQGEVAGVLELGGHEHRALAGRSRRAHRWGPLELPSVGAVDGRRVPHRMPAPFAVVVDDVLGPDGWTRRRR
jgi:hypothetical protein